MSRRNSLRMWSGKQNTDNNRQAEGERQEEYLSGGLLGFHVFAGAEHARGKRTGSHTGSDADGRENHLNRKTDGKGGQPVAGAAPARRNR